MRKKSSLFVSNSVPYSAWHRRIKSYRAHLLLSINHSSIWVGDGLERHDPCTSLCQHTGSAFLPQVDAGTYVRTVMMSICVYDTLLVVLLWWLVDVHHLEIGFYITRSTMCLNTIIYSLSCVCVLRMAAEHVALVFTVNNGLLAVIDYLS